MGHRHNYGYGNLSTNWRLIQRMLHYRWIRRLRDIHPDHHAIARGMAWVTLFVLFSSLARAAKEMAIAYRYGISAEVDAYLFVFNLVTWPVQVWLGVIILVLVPMAARIRQCAPGDLPRFRSELLGLTLLLGLALAIFGWLALPLLLRSTWAGLPDATVAIAVDMAPVLALLAPLGVIISLLSTWMLASSKHTNTLLESVPALAIMVALIVFPGGGGDPLIWGTVAGLIFHLASLAAPLAWQGAIEAPRFTFRSPQWTPFWQGFGVMLVGQALMSFTGLIDQFYAAHLGTGANATLSYANRILALILGLGALAVARATLPIFSQALAQGSDQSHRLAVHWAQLLFVLGIATMLASWWLAPWGVKLLFERGAFTSQDTIIVTELLRYGLTQLPFYFAATVLLSFMSSQGRYREIAVVGGINLMAKVASVAILVPILGLNGIAISNSIVYASSLLLLSFRLSATLADHR